MENPPILQSEHPNGERAADETAGARPKPQPLPERPALNSLRDAIRKGAEDARTAAEQTIPNVKSAAASAAYWTAYGVSFAAVFHWALATGFTPESLKSGVRDGVQCGREAAAKWIETLRQRKARATDATPIQPSPSGEAAQPGTA